MQNLIFNAPFFSDFSPRDIGSHIMGMLKNYGKVYNIESEVKTKSGELRSIMYTAALIEMKGEEAVISVMVDITERKKLEDALRQSQKMDVIGQLTGGIAHDFNNMLAGIMGSAEILKLKIKDKPDLLKHVDVVMKSSDRAADLIKKLMAFARRGIEITTIIDSHEIITESVVILERSIDRKIKIGTQLNALSSFVKGDPVLLQNVILNLGLNARDAMPHGGSLTISTDNVIVDEKFIDQRHYEIVPGKYVAIYVEDTGSGMNSDLQTRIFEPFFTTKPEGKGTGLGLSVVYGTVKEHHGFIEVYSEPGEGAIIKVYLPAAEPGAEGEIINEYEPLGGDGAVLVVDDEDIVCTIAGSLLESLGYKCFFAENGLEAIKIYAQEKDRIDAVLLDIIMPGISGVETYQRLLEIDENVKVVFSSGFRRDERVGGLIKSGKKRFIQKPYHLMELSRIIHETIYGD
jgi:signal transduction histidine kinase/CheY-like chemotaxis protein